MSKLLVLALLVAVAVPTAASAAEVQQGVGGTDGVVVIGYSADPRNDLTLTQAGADLIIDDAAAPLKYSGNCRQENPNRVVCPMPHQYRLNIATGDNDDSVTMRLGADAPQADIYTHGGDDTIVGGQSVEAIDAGDGNDVITPGGGRDNVTGGSGNDRIDTWDAPAGADPSLHRFPDAVDCGDGRDTWRADLDDLPSNSERACETIDSPDRTEDFLTGGSLEFRSRTIDVRKVAFSAKVKCGTAERCRHELRLFYSFNLVAVGKVALRAGASGTVKLKLTSYGKALLKARRSVKVAAQTSAADLRLPSGSVRLRWVAR